MGGRLPVEGDYKKIVAGENSSLANPGDLVISPGTKPLKHNLMVVNAKPQYANSPLVVGIVFNGVYDGESTIATGTELNLISYALLTDEFQKLADKAINKL